MRYYLTLLLLTMWLALSAQQTAIRITVSIPATTLEAALKLVQEKERRWLFGESDRV
jgi:hypothetical protein